MRWVRRATRLPGGLPTTATRGQERGHAPFPASFVWASLTLALIFGFAIGGHLSFVIGFDRPLSAGFAAFIQVHGHAQLVGWAGLLIMGISLHVVPRLASVPGTAPTWHRAILWLMVMGLAVRGIGQSVLPYLAESSPVAPVRWVVAAAGLLEWAGIMTYAALLGLTFRAARKGPPRPALMAVRPFFAMMVGGWVAYGWLNLGLVGHMAWHGAVEGPQVWNQWAMRIFLDFVLLPVAFAFSVRMFPLYLRLPAPDWGVRPVAYGFLAGVLLEVLPMAPPFLRWAQGFPLAVSALGTVVKAATILVFVWKLDVLTRRRAPWTVHRVGAPGPDRPPTRHGLPDSGEFGAFEWLIYAAYTWLVVGAMLDLLTAATVLLRSRWTLAYDPVRHLYLLGFITHLICGTSVRMLPGLFGRKRIASAGLVRATLWLGTGAVFARVGPLLLPSAFFDAVPAGIPVAQAAFGISGTAGVAAIACLAVNLWRTARGTAPGVSGSGKAGRAGPALKRRKGVNPLG